MIIGICDDELSYLETITLLTNRWKEEFHADLPLFIKTYQTAEALSCDWEAGIHFDLLFLDIKLPFDSGLNLAMEIRKVDPYVPIVFTTSHAQFAVAGYEAAAFRFLIKPLREEQIYPCLNHAYSLLPAPNQPDFYIIKDGARIRIFLQNIVSITCGYHQAFITTTCTSEPYSVRLKGSFDDLLQTLSAPFFIRCHKSHVINAMYVEGLTRTDIKMLNGERIPISRAYIKDVLIQLHNYSIGGLL